MHRNPFAPFAVLSLLVPAFVAAPRVAAGAPVQVYIMMGQSNMLGMGTVAGATDGTLEYAVTTKNKYPYLGAGPGHWNTRNDVRNVRVMSSGLGAMSVHNNEWMSVAAESDNLIGPEYGIGHYLGEAVDAPVMLLKSCIGNRSLGWDLLPPGSQQFQYNDGGTNYTYAGYGDSPSRWVTGTTPTPISWYAGTQYDGDVRNIKTVLNNLGTYFPGATQYEIAGFFWWQGDKDRYDAGHAARYEQNLVHLIEQLRTEFNAPNANFVSATLGQTAMGSTSNMNEKYILEAQLAVDGNAAKYPGYTGKYPQFKDNVATVYAHPLSLGGASNNHYNNNAETYMNVGEAMGQVMVSLLRTPPYVTVDQQTGEIKIVNPADGDLNMAFKDLSITSAAGALKPANWTAITGNYDRAGNRSVDADGNWTVTTATKDKLSEAAQAGGGDGLISIAQAVSLGVGAWIQNPARDLRFTYTDLDGLVKQLSVRYIGTSTPLADLNFDGSVSALDWPVFLGGNQRDLTSLSAAEAYQMGDLDGDGDNDIYDFALFRGAFEAENPAPGAFDAMVAASAPEPGSAVLLAAGAMGLALWRRSSRRIAAVAVGAVLAALALTAPVAGAATVATSATAPVVDGADIAMLNQTGASTSNGKLWTDTPVLGQTFSVGSTCMILDAITVQSGTLALATKTYSMRIGQVSGTSFTALATESATQTGTVNANDYVTFTLGTPLFLWSDTVYGFDVAMTGSTTAWGTGIPYLKQNADTNYAGGQGYSTGANHIPGATIGLGTFDRVFHLNLTATEAPKLTLRVNTNSGATTLLGHSTQSISMNYYQISSAGASLDAANWTSLDDQNFGGSVWEEAGGARSRALAEAYLLGSSTIGAATSVGLGRGYDVTVGARDLAFTYRTNTGKIVDGLVQYVSVPTAWTNTTGNKKWSDAGNWNEGVPNVAGVVAHFGNAAATVTVDANVKVGAMKFTATNNYSVGGTNSITMQTTAGNALVDLQGSGTTHTVSVPLVIASSTDINGPGALTAGDVSTNSGTTLNVNTTVSAGDIGGLGNTSVAAGARLTADSIVQDTLTIGPGGSVTIRAMPVGAAEASPVPEPGSLLLLAVGAVGLAVRIGKRSSRGL